jgi:hypothetical protein
MRIRLGRLAIEYRRSDAAPPRPSAPGVLSFRCNVCGEPAVARAAELARERPSCERCRSTVRTRAMIHVLSRELFGQSLALPDFPRRPELVGMGMSDWEGYAGLLAQRLSYTNTYYHREPRLDITAIDPARAGTLDFLIASDVFEHIAPPVSRAFENARRLLKPTGVLVFSVPYTKAGATVEHFPDLHDYRIVEEGGRQVLRNTTREGVLQVFRDLVFHGGGGATLEMRVFSESSLLDDVRRAGFGRVTIYRDPDFDHGIFWSEDWSLPLAARP